MNNQELKNKIIKFAQDGLIKYCGISLEEAARLVKEAELEKSIDRAPDIMAHYSQEQLVCTIMR